MNAFLLLAIAILSEVIATSALRASDGFTRPLPSAVVVVGYGLAFYLMAQVLRTLPLGLTYAIWSGVGTALTAAVGWLYFRDAFHPAALGGIALIVVGVAVLNAVGGARH